MLRMSAPIGHHLQVGPDKETERAELLRKAATMAVDTITIKSVPADWTDNHCREARAFLDANGLRVGEFTGFVKGKGSAGGLGAWDQEDYDNTLEIYRRQLRQAKLLGAHFVGFALLVGIRTPAMWSNETWERCLKAIGELVQEAEKVGIDVGAHPHVMTPIHSVDRYKDMLDRIPSPRLKVLIDPVNMVWPHLIYQTDRLLNDIFDALGEQIIGVHAKDVVISGGGKVITHVDEAVPGQGNMDYFTMARRLGALKQDVTVHAEHFPYAETIQGQEYIRSVGRQVGVEIR
ncbi:MAG: sugar phosphate isomerase/epimerase [SAR202 cluster bacterium]|nr:sugar phosphate isomerase/epimerase [SAR202 cluster bacterium]